jgi:hypothetical protein
MINSILNTPRKTIKLDRLIQTTPELTVVTNPSTIKQIVKQHFAQWTTINTHIEISQHPEWITTYEPLTHIQTELFDHCITLITPAEILSTLKTTKNESAPGLSGIKYIFLKNLGNKTISVLADLFSQILVSGEVPT